LSPLTSSIWSPISGGITTPNGFLAAGISAGLKPSGKKDLALLYAPDGACCSGTFTQSVTRAYCVDLCIERIKASQGKIRAVLINSGFCKRVVIAVKAPKEFPINTTFPFLLISTISSRKEVN